MIKSKPTDPFWMVLSEDPALLPAGAKTMQEYLLDRDISHFDIDIENGVYKPTSEKVTMFKVVPLRNESFYLIELGIDGFSAIVKSHIVKVRNFGEEIRVRQTKDGTTEVDDDDLKKLDLAVLTEVATVIIEKGRGKDGVDRAFFSEDTSRRARIRSQQLPANLARVDLAKDTPTDTNLEK